SVGGAAEPGAIASPGRQVVCDAAKMLGKASDRQDEGPAGRRYPRNEQQRRSRSPDEIRSAITPGVTRPLGRFRLEFTPCPLEGHAGSGSARPAFYGSARLAFTWGESLQGLLLVPSHS